MLVLSEFDLQAVSVDDIDIIKIKPNEILNYNKNTDIKAVICCRKTAAQIERLEMPNLSLIQLTSEGFDNVPVDTYAKKKIAVANAGGAYSIPISEMIVYGILRMAKKYNYNPNNQRFRLLRNYKYITELSEKKVLILGAGRIGTATANRLSSFEMCIFAYDPYCEEREPYRKIYRTREELKQNISEFDYIISTLPATNETKGFINEELITKMKKDAIFVNVGRRNSINEKDLYNALKSKMISGAVLDMFEKIPNPITNRFRRLRNVIVLPGVAAISKEVKPRLKRHILNNLSLLNEGKNPTGIVNRVSIEKEN